MEPLLKHTSLHGDIKSRINFFCKKHFTSRKDGAKFTTLKSLPSPALPSPRQHQNNKPHVHISEVNNRKKTRKIGISERNEAERMFIKKKMENEIRCAYMVRSGLW